MNTIQLTCVSFIGIRLMFNMAEIIKKIRFLVVGKYIDNDPRNKIHQETAVKRLIIGVWQIMLIER